MPSIRQLQQTTTPIEIKRGDVTIVLNARLERISGSDTEYQRLRAAELALGAQYEALTNEISEQVAKISELKAPDESRFLTFRGAVADHLQKIDAALQEDTDLAAGEVSAAIETVTTFDAEVLPSDEEITEREAAAKTALKAIEKKIKKNGEEMQRNQAERLVYLLDPERGWDLTEGDGEDAPMWPITVENVMTFSPQLRAQMLREVEGAVFRGPFG